MALFEQPEVRLFLRALVAAGIAFAAKFAVVQPAGGHVAYGSQALTAALVGGGLAFAETFTPLNNLVGLFKQMDTPHALTLPTEPPEDGTTEPKAIAAVK